MLRSSIRLILFPLILSILVLASCGRNNLIQSEVPLVEVEGDSVMFAVIGDYGHDGEAEAQVAELVKSWEPELIITTGDNNYPNGKEESLGMNIGKHYCDFIYNPDAPKGQVCKGIAWEEEFNRFFPSTGNHDWSGTDGFIPMLNYFTLPGKEQYYDFIWGPVHFFAVTSGPDGQLGCCEDPQALWLHQGLTTSPLPWKIVYFHHSPWSASNHGNDEGMQWRFREWGASAVITGHDHVYQRITEMEFPEFPYFVNGLGGRPFLYGCNSNPLDSTRFDQFCYNENHGAMRVQATKYRIEFQFVSLSDTGGVVDSFVLEK